VEERVSLSNPVLLAMGSIAMCLFGVAIGVHWSRNPGVAVWIALSAGLLMVLHDLLVSLIWFGIAMKWTNAVKQSGSGKRPAMEPEQYVRTLLEELERAKRSLGYGLPHAIALDRDSFCVLLGIGDVRVRLPVDSLDPDPKKAAEKVVIAWRSMSVKNLDAAIEE